jgi:hypothetical protein
MFYAMHAEAAAFDACIERIKRRTSAPCRVTDGEFRDVQVDLMKSLNRTIQRAIRWEPLKATAALMAGTTRIKMMTFRLTP